MKAKEKKEAPLPLNDSAPPSGDLREHTISSTVMKEGDTLREGRAQVKSVSRTCSRGG